MSSKYENLNVNPGDIVEISFNNIVYLRGVVTRVLNKPYKFYVVFKDGIAAYISGEEDIRVTGEHIDIDSLLDKI